ncbi:uncharacterized protein N7473_006928 [Penicillium subrubescens]|uniref:uncharacterized protein n=1 Tax=Penicillium subrubescens TaxID=1316194 RepID=UPI002544DF0F|nr:uncharacterized protein N7473_006928 [Penicillium subrubescens]KAJ5890700.1 hypothetical protein N7473_006928 [Penicillium subrubescens]
MDIDSEVAGLLQQYQNLPDSCRQEIWHDLPAQLSPDEWHRIKAKNGSNTFPYDILGSLPLEIASLVAEHLPVVEIVRLRRVYSDII